MSFFRRRLPSCSVNCDTGAPGTVQCRAEKRPSPVIAWGTPGRRPWATGRNEGQEKRAGTEKLGRGRQTPAYISTKRLRKARPDRARPSWQARGKEPGTTAAKMGGNSTRRRSGAWKGLPVARKSGQRALSRVFTQDAVRRLTCCILRSDAMRAACVFVRALVPEAALQPGGRSRARLCSTRARLAAPVPEAEPAEQLHHTGGFSLVGTSSNLPRRPAPRRLRRARRRPRRAARTAPDWSSPKLLPLPGEEEAAGEGLYADVLLSHRREDGRLLKIAPLQTGCMVCVACLGPCLACLACLGPA